MQKPTNVTIQVGRMSDALPVLDEDATMDEAAKPVLSLEEQSWFCPNCGKPAELRVCAARLLTCKACSWTFVVRLHRNLAGTYHDAHEDPCTLCGLAK